MNSMATEFQRGTRKHDALTALHALGGETDIAIWMDACWCGSDDLFQKNIVTFLMRLKMIHVIDDRVTIMNAGLWAIGLKSTNTDCITASVAAPRQAPPVRPLSKAHMVRPSPRPGAFDYARIPSLMGGQRVPHHATVVAGEDAE